jgi:uncharacterized protein YndB with AHSA1/START domain
MLFILVPTVIINLLLYSGSLCPKDSLLTAHFKLYSLLLPDMEQPLFVENTILINAPIDQVWDAMVNPEMTKIYMFGCETVSDWKPGSPLLWKGQYEGKELVFVKGLVFEIDPPFRLVYTVIDPNSGMEDIPENYLKVTYQLETDGPKTQLTVRQDGFEGAARGQERYQEIYNEGKGWDPILKAIANLLEKS